MGSQRIRPDLVTESNSNSSKAPSPWNCRGIPSEKQGRPEGGAQSRLRLSLLRPDLLQLQFPSGETVLARLPT